MSSPVCQNMLGSMGSCIIVSGKYLGRIKDTYMYMCKEYSWVMYVRSSNMHIVLKCNICEMNGCVVHPINRFFVKLDIGFPSKEILYSCIRIPTNSLPAMAVFKSPIQVSIVSIIMAALQC